MCESRGHAFAVVLVLNVTSCAVQDSSGSPLSRSGPRAFHGIGSSHNNTAGSLKVAHALLNTAPVDDGPWLEDAELAAEALALLLKADD